jgi:hypothetical protein
VVIMSTDESPDRTVHAKDPAEGGENEVDESLADRKGPAQADADAADPTMGGTSDGDTGA